MCQDRDLRGWMDLPERFADRLAIAKLNEDFCFELDRGTPSAFSLLFAQDALYTRGVRILKGRAEILAFAEGRRTGGPRTSRHVQSGLRIDFAGGVQARGVSTCTTFAASADPPIASTLPVLVADFLDTYGIEDDSWRIIERHIVPIFTASAG